MTLMRWDPFNSFIGSNKGFEACFANWDEKLDSGANDWRPLVDIFETKDNLVLSAELPGLNKKDIKINIENNTLTLSGERKFSDEIKKENFHRIERSYGSFSRSFTLPTRIDKNKVEAKFTDGILEIQLPKVEEAKPREIKISVN